MFQSISQTMLDEIHLIRLREVCGLEKIHFLEANIRHFGSQQIIVSVRLHRLLDGFSQSNDSWISLFLSQKIQHVIEHVRDGRYVLLGGSHRADIHH
jgi:hypothetical protein